MVRNKKGLIKIVEAVVAILLVLGVLLIISFQNKKSTNDNLENELHGILEEIAQNESFRENIIVNGNSSESLLESYVERVYGNKINVDIRVCGLNEVCELNEISPLETNKEIISVERVISSFITSPSFMPQRIKIFAWRKD